MRTILTAETQELHQKFAELAEEVQQQKAENIQKRLTSNPYPTIEENALGAFMEMYEPHLLPIVQRLLQKGYLVEPTSGFAKDHPECQILVGQFYLEEKIINILGKMGVVVHKETNPKYFKFSPKIATLEAIVEMFEQIVAVFPPLKGDIEISQSESAKKFRRTYTPHDKQLKQTRLFEILMYEIQERVSRDVISRLKQNPKPTEIELHLGAFMEMLEPQVRDAVVEIHKKGYSTDASGFMGQSDMQVIEGDFSIPESMVKKLEADGIAVITNNSGYTRIQFQPKEADFDQIHRIWMNIAAALPDLHKQASPCMTVKARAFRKKHAPQVKSKG